MRTLIVGNGGREHALAHALARSSRVTELLATRPNAGMSALCEDVDIAPTDVTAIVEFATERKIQLVVVGPEAPLVGGLVDQLQGAGIAALGPSKAAAQIEGSKRFAKELMQEADIPTAAYASFTDVETAVQWLREKDQPMVVKADGLAAGKGVTVCKTVAETEDAIRSMLSGARFGAASTEIILEEVMTGPEISVIALVDGETVRLFPPARDHKRAYDNDQGPNTGGMGAFSPIPNLSEDILPFVQEQVLQPVVTAMAQRGTPFRGFLYAGLMLTPEGPKVLEFNCRMGDPECQILMARLASDAGDVFYAAATGELSAVALDFDPRPGVCVVIASGGYPTSYQKGYPITGLVHSQPAVTVYHAGTRLDGDQTLTSGGRVLGVTALGESFPEAIANAYEVAAGIRFEGCFMRQDIAASAT